VCGWDRRIAVHVDLIPDSQLIACHVISGTSPTQGRNSTSAGIVEMRMPESGGKKMGRQLWRTVGSDIG